MRRDYLIFLFSSKTGYFRNFEDQKKRRRKKSFSADTVQSYFLASRVKYMLEVSGGPNPAKTVKTSFWSYLSIPSWVAKNY